jgi:homoserine/homoserine lactone efflux protein
MSWHTWLIFVVTISAIIVTPGPAVLLVTSQALQAGPVRALWANVGILSANILYFGLSALGFGAVLLQSVTLFTWLRYAGVAYLVYLGLQHWRATDALGVSPEPHRSGTALFRSAFLVQTANPKALVFFTALLPQFVDPGQRIAPQVAVLTITSTVLEFIGLAGYGYLAGRARHLASDPRFVRITRRCAGACLIAAATGLALSRSR